MGIKARDLNLTLDGTKANVQKIMGTDPRRIIEIEIDIEFSNNFDSKFKMILERAAKTCPVANSLHPDLKQNLTFIWPE